MDSIAEEPSGEDTTSNEGSEHNVAEHHDSDNIKLQRVTGVSFRHTKAPPASVLKEGWLVHYTNKSNIVSLSVCLSVSLSTCLPVCLPAYLLVSLVLYLPTFCFSENEVLLATGHQVPDSLQVRD